MAMYWNNGVAIDLTPDAFISSALTNSIAVSALMYMYVEPLLIRMQPISPNTGKMVLKFPWVAVLRAQYL